ncbi:hypothetical protein BU25DRAFT_421718 [Macroventuria anomochaeta]|uniref:Uncharacterized protein n=1 Tax=Macroventuria anomochaeta TaxID=301207 RepID=A0ACB6S184_9PLEO|nr:uncharacterized protein BU25DRAFT_421718 [Macroventuria anomochaeta]KAF2627267.1 hypothetical protein BU25DRAFT_421718 [Macroventuria anomochaeta]
MPTLAAYCCNAPKGDPFPISQLPIPLRRSYSQEHAREYCSLAQTERFHLVLMPTALQCFHLRMPAAHDIISPASSIVLRLLSLPIFSVLPTAMPPLSDYKKLHYAGQFVSSSKYSRLLQVFLVVLTTVTIAWIVVAYVSQRKSRTVDASGDVPEKPVTRRLLERQDSAICQKQWGFDHNNHLNSLKQEILQHTERPVHPWILPPQALPGPYDPMYYPLPAPSFRCKSSSSLPANVEGTHSTSYTRLVPKSGTPPGEAVLYGTMTTSTNGWRRTHWNVTGG